jgi:hypothetical protein
MSTKAPWNSEEKWEYGMYPNGKRWARVTGRKRAPESLKRNPLWWVKNDFEDQVEEATWYHPEWPEWKRKLYWNYFRNPLQNFRQFVAGVADRNYTVDVLEGNPDPMVYQRNDVKGPDGKEEHGYQKSRLTLDDGTFRYWTSYSGPRVVWYYGHNPSGFYGAKFNLHRE